MPDERILFVAAGEVTGCIDLTKITRDAIVVTGDSAEITLPQPEICYVKIDHKKSRVYDTKMAFFREADLVDAAYKEAERKLTEEVKKSKNLANPETLQATIITEKVKHDTDDPAIWINKANPSQSLIIGTDKDADGALYAFNLSGKVVKRVGGIKRPNNVDIAYGITLNGKKIDIAKMRLNTYDNRLEYQEGEQVKLFTLPVTEYAVDAEDGAIRLFKRGFPKVDRQNEDTYYEVLYDGKYKLLKYYKAHKLDVTNYNSATKMIKFEIGETLYVLRPDNSIHKLKKDKKSILEALGKEEEALKSWWSKEKPNPKDEAGVVNIIGYVDTL